MESEYETAHYDKLFGNCLITWKIENFCLATCLENYCIVSSDFCVNGPKTTRWKFTFIPRVSYSSCVILNLERLNDSGPTSVYAKWSLAIETIHENCHYSEYKNEFQKLTKIKIDVQNLSDILLALQPFETDTLIIRCHLIVRHRDKTIKIDKPITSGLRCLSDDLRLMFKSEMYKDITIKFDKKEIMVHKVMLSLNAFLNKCLENSHDDTIVFSHINFTAVARFILFLYTGDMESILKHPSVRMYRCLASMDNVILKCYFIPEELSLSTKIKVETIEHSWIIPDFSNRKECIKSPLFKKCNLDTTWQLRLHPIAADNVHFLSIYADIVEGQKPSNVCLEFGVEDCKGEVYYPDRILSFNGNYDSGLKEFVRSDDLNATSIVTDDTLNLFFRARTWEGEHSSTIGSHIITFVTECKESSYELLSKNMLNLFQLGEYSDILVQASNIFYTAHKCILSARSPVLSEMIKGLKDPKTLTLEGITPRTLRMLLEYIYSGVLHKLDSGDLIMLQRAAETYHILSLVQDCQQAMQALPSSNEKDVSGITDCEGNGY